MDKITARIEELNARIFDQTNKLEDIIRRINHLLMRNELMAIQMSEPTRAPHLVDEELDEDYSNTVAA